MAGNLDLDIIALLGKEEGEMYEEDLVENTGVTQEALRRECNRLEDAGLAGKHRSEDGDRVYQLSPVFQRVTADCGLVEAEGK